MHTIVHSRICVKLHPSLDVDGSAQRLAWS